MVSLNRRQALAGFGSVSLGALIAACSDDEGPPLEAQTGEGTDTEFDGAARCTLTAEQTEGPFYFDVDRIRSDIREDREGAPLLLRVRVRDQGAGCEPIRNAVVDIWHCDAEGSYSAQGQTFLRGAQVTNAEGIAEFATIYPGWYPGRTVHIHGKVHLDRETVLTTQFYFADDVTARVFVDDPYPSESNRDGFNASDGLYDESLELTLSERGDGYRGLITLDVARA
jgi:protocatechuate 3,4-dioxygenase beta subunit